MSLKPTNDIADRITAGGQSKHDADPSRIERWEPGLKPRQMMGYSLATGHRRTRAMLPTKEHRGVDREPDFPAWHRPFVEALLATESKATALFSAAEMVIFARILELSDFNDSAGERRDIDRAIEVIQILRHRT